MTTRGSLLKRAIAATIIFGMVFSSLPNVLADDDWSSANILTDGSSGSDSVDHGSDADDWWTIDLVNGDRLDITVQSPTGDYGFDLFGCFGTDHWEGKVQIWDAIMSNGAPERNEKRFDQDFSSSGSSTVTALVNPAAPDWGSHSGPTTWYIMVRSKDTCARDDFDYTISPSIDTTYRDTDEDGFVDDNDDCPDDYGTSGPNTDRNGCVDNDGDGWSNYGDEFPDEETQWEDSDQDGYGDNANGVNGDQCSIAWGDSFEDRYGCPDRDNDGWSDPDSWGEWGPVWTTADGGDAF